jgi:hypothetical protein
VDDLDGAAALLAQAFDLLEVERGVTAIDVADHVGIRFQHHILVDVAGARH